MGKNIQTAGYNGAHMVFWIEVTFCEILKSEIQSYREGTCNFTILNFKKDLGLGKEPGSVSRPESQHFTDVLSRFV